MSMLEKLRQLTAAAPAPVEKPRITQIIAPAGTRPANWQIVANAPVSPTGRIRPAVKETDDLERILSLTRRPPRNLDANVDTSATTARYRRENPNCKCAEYGRPCIKAFKPAQAWALEEIEQVGGLLGPIGVGHGKTGLDIMAPIAMPGCKVAVLLIPPNLRQQFLRDYLAWSEHFMTPTLVLDDKMYLKPGMPVLHVVPFSKFSRATATMLLESIQPDTIIIDEAHKARHPQTATTGRILRYFKKFPKTRLCCWSGTLTSKSIKDYAHLSSFALREGSPLPLDPNVVVQWSQAIDPSDWPAPLGDLYKLCRPGEHIYSGFNRRLIETPGVVATKAGAIDAAINIHERLAGVPDQIRHMLVDLRNSWTRPDGEEFVDTLSVQACARQLACGFYYRWKFPRGESAELIDAWFAARKSWFRELRMKLKDRRESLDSELLCRNAAIRAAAGYKGDLPVWHSEFWEPWAAIKDQVQPEPEAVWIDDYLIHDAAAWAHKHRGIVWVKHGAFGRRLSKESGLPFHAGGLGAEERILAETGKKSIIASIKAHGTGRDGLQLKYCEQHVADPPASGDEWEQLLGRLHRIGQEADEVDTWVYRHTAELRDAVDDAVLKARYIQGTLGTYQKLLSANCDFIE